jgi:lipid-A-disaccharide synthase
LLAGGEKSQELRNTFLELHESIRRNADEQAAQAVMELASQ